MAFFMLALYHARVFTTGTFILFIPIRKKQVPIHPCREAFKICFEYGAVIRCHIENKSFGNPCGIPSPFRSTDCVIVAPRCLPRISPLHPRNHQPQEEISRIFTINLHEPSDTKYIACLPPVSLTIKAFVRTFSRIESGHLSAPVGKAPSLMLLP